MKAREDFCAASGLKVNLDKSRAMYSSNIPSCWRENFTSISSIRFASDLDKYLDFPLTQGRACKATFAELLSKIQNRLASWKGNS